MLKDTQYCTYIIAVLITYMLMIYSFCYRKKMDPVLCLKRGSNLDISQCVVCQGIKAEKLVKPTENGVLHLKECAHLRLKYRDTKNRLVIDNILSVLDAY